MRGLSLRTPARVVTRAVPSAKSWRRQPERANPGGGGVGGRQRPTLPRAKLEWPPPEAEVPARQSDGWTEGTVRPPFPDPGRGLGMDNPEAGLPV